MKLLVDQGFPASISENRSISLELWRWPSDAVTDEELVDAAASNGMQGVVFVGQASLLSPDLRNHAAKRSVALIGTGQQEPIAAGLAVSTNLAALERLVAPGAVLVVHKNRVESI